MHQALVEELGEDPDTIEQRYRRERAQEYQR